MGRTGIVKIPRNGYHESVLSINNIKNVEPKLSPDNTLLLNLSGGKYVVLLDKETGLLRLI